MTAARRPPPPWTIRSAASLAELEGLEATTRAVFGDGDRPPGWLARKLVREVIDPELSLIAFGPAGAILGYVLVGAPASLGVARTAGLGVLPGARRRGLGAALIAAACDRARAAGLDRIITLAEPDLESYYRRVDFTTIEVTKTLIAGRRSGAAQVDAALRCGPPAPWSQPRTIAVGGWLEEAWTRTPAAKRATWRYGHEDAAGVRPQVWAHVSREGAASLVHRLLLADDLRGEALVDAAVAAAERLRAALTPSGPLLLYGLPAASPCTDALIAARWAVAQVALVMARPLD